MSQLKNMSLALRHTPYAGFGGLIPSVNLTIIAYPETYHFRAGKRTPPRYTYSPFFPALAHDDTAAAFFGGNFWDCRSTGQLLLSPGAEDVQPSSPESH